MATATPGLSLATALVGPGGGASADSEEPRFAPTALDLDQHGRAYERLTFASRPGEGVPRTFDPDPDGLAHRHQNFARRPQVEEPPEPEPPSWSFDPTRITTRDGSGDTSSHYNIPRIIEDVPDIWDRVYAEDIRGEFRDEFVRTGGREGETFGELFTRIGIELDVDPLALATYSIFESYDIRTTEERSHGSFNPHMRDVAGSMHAAGIAATQAQHVHGRQVPGLELHLPDSIDDASDMLRANPELGVRFLAEEFEFRFSESGDLSEAMIRVAFPAWSEGQSLIGYGTQAEYVSRAHAIYEAFAATAD